MQNCSGETLSKPWVQSMATKKTKLIKFIIRHTHKPQKEMIHYEISLCHQYKRELAHLEWTI